MNLVQSAQAHLKRLCVDIDSRRVGSPGNHQATDYFAEVVGAFQPEVRLHSFECMDWHTLGATLEVDGNSFEIFSSPYSLGCNVSCTLKATGNLEELQALEMTNCLLLVYGDLAREQLMPTHFPFYNPPEHQRIFQLLIEKHPQAILTATSRNPELVGGIYPFPLIEDGDFNLPSVFLTEDEGKKLISCVGKIAHLISLAERIPSYGCNVVARFNSKAPKKIVLTAHIDDKDGSPGALDNAGGVVVLLLLAELLADFHGNNCIELVAVNGEDYYGACGEIVYLRENQDHLQDILLNINFDGVAYREGSTVFSLYDCEPELASLIRSTVSRVPEIIEGNPWFQGDHMVFVQNKLPAMALTSQQFLSLFTTITHTPSDRIELVDCGKLADIAQSVRHLLVALDGYFS